MPRRPIRRRRPLGRPFRRPGMIRPGEPKNRGIQIPPALLEANQMFRSGQYEEAAKRYILLGEKAAARNLRQAPNLFLQAARSYFFLGELTLAIKYLNQGMTILASEKRWVDLYRIGRKSTNLLAEKGYQEQADSLQQWISNTIPTKVIGNLKNHELQLRKLERPSLPSHCSQCGGIINPDEVEWGDDHSTAICSYCGSIINGES